MQVVNSVNIVGKVSRILTPYSEEWGYTRSTIQVCNPLEDGQVIKESINIDMKGAHLPYGATVEIIVNVVVPEETEGD